MNTASSGLPEDLGTPGRHVLLSGGAILSMDPQTGDFATGDLLIEGGKIAAVGPRLECADAFVIDATGMIVMPGFIDTHHHQFETPLRGLLADGLLSNDGRPHGTLNYSDYVLQRLTKVFRPQDVYISELLGSLAQLDAGVTTVMDVSQIHHSPEHSDAAVDALKHAGRRSVLGYFEGAFDRSLYPIDAHRLRAAHFSSNDQLLTMAMGGEIYLPGHEQAWAIGRDLDLPIALHVVGAFGMTAPFEQLAAGGHFGPDNIFIHMTGMSDTAWLAVVEAGARISLSVPIEMTMRHGTPPILKALEYGLQPSLSSDVECTMSADFFTQMRAAFTLQRCLVNEAALRGQSDLPELLTSRDVIRFATVEGAKCLRLDRKVGSITPGKDADIILLDATAINVAPLNFVPGAVVTLMDRSNVDTVMVAGNVRKWRGNLLAGDLAKHRRELEATRDYIFDKAGIEQDLFRI
jgi:cytosine/adenosine deaminase-related metal-dependent hydrolase